MLKAHGQARQSEEECTRLLNEQTDRVCLLRSWTGCATRHLTSSAAVAKNGLQCAEGGARKRESGRNVLTFRRAPTPGN